MTRVQELLFATAIGAIGGWVISTAPAWMHASSHKHWWDIATALGTMGAALGAVVVALMNRAHQVRDSISAADRYTRSNFGVLVLMRRRLLEALACVSLGSDKGAEKRTQEAAEALKALDIERIGLAHPEVAESISNAQFSLALALEEIELLPHTADRCRELIQSAEKALGKATAALLDGID